MGDAGRPNRSGERRPCEGDIASVRAIDKFSPPDGLVVDGGSNLWLFIVGRGDPIPLADASDAELEYLWPIPETLRIESSLDGDLEGRLSRADLSRSSISAVLSLDIPGNRILPTIVAVSDESF